MTEAPGLEPIRVRIPEAVRLRPQPLAHLAGARRRSQGSSTSP